MKVQAKANGYDSKLHAAISDYLYAVLAPTVRVLIRLGWSAPDAEKVIRWVFVKEFYSSPEFWRAEQPTALQGAIKIGISRQQVGKLNDVPAPELALLTPRQNLACRVIQGWLSDPTFRNGHDAAVLPLRSAGGPTFNRLVGKYAGDVTPGAILADLCEQGCVHVEDGKVRLVNRNYGINFATFEILRVAGHSQRWLGETIDFNLKHPNPAERRTQRVWWQPCISRREAPAAMSYLHQEIVAWGRKTDAFMLSEFGDVANGNCVEDENSVEVGFGVYVYQNEGVRTPA